MTDLTVKHPPGTLIVLPAELVNDLAQYLSHCSESAHDEPEDPAHTLVKAIDAAYASSVLVSLEFATPSERMTGDVYVLESSRGQRPDTP